MKGANEKETSTTVTKPRAKNGLEKELWGRKFKVVDKGLDESEICSFLGALIEENNSIFRKLQHLDSLMELAENAVAGARKQAELITLEAEQEASDKASAILAEAEQRAKAVSDRIISEARREAEKAAQEIKTRAEGEASRILAEANQRAEELVRQRMASAEEEARELVRQKKERFKRIYQELLASLDSIDIRDISSKLSMEDILCTS